MYKPAPARSTKTNFTRARTGCCSCRKRRSRCDEVKPSCGRCKQQGKRCEYKQPVLEFRDVTSAFTQRKNDARCPTSQRLSHLGEINISSECFNNYPTGSVLTDTNLRAYLSTGTASPSVQSLPSFWAQFGRLSASTGDLDETLISNFTSESPPSLENSPSSTIRASPTRMEFQILPSTPVTSYDFPLLEAPRISGPHLEKFPGDASISQSPTTYQDTSARRECAITLEGTYLTHWNINVLDALPPVFRELTPNMSIFPPLKEAILALSACNLGRKRPQLKNSPNATTDSKSYGPCRTNQHHSQNYYNVAISQLAHLDEKQYKSEVVLIFAVLLLFGSIEIGIGSFRGFCLHLHGVERLISDQYHRIRATRIGRKLLGAWIRLRAYNWLLRLPFATLSFQRSFDSMGIAQSMEDIFSTYDMRREAVLQILCESHRLNCMVLMERVVLQDKAANDTPHTFKNVYDHQIQRGFCKPGRVKDPIPSEDFIALLIKESHKLGKWHAMLQLWDLPIDSFAPERFASKKERDAVLDIQPLRFNSHDVAMDYAYYVTAQMLQCTSILDELTKAEPTSLQENDIHPWILLLLRIVAGINITACVQHNTYTVGVSTLLLSAVLRSPSLLVGEWAEQWLLNFQRLMVFDEGSMPILQMLDILRTLNSEKEKGRHIFAMGNAGGTDGVRLDSYNDQNMTSIVVFGKELSKGNLFCEHMPIKER